MKCSFGEYENKNKQKIFILNHIFQIKHLKMYTHLYVDIPCRHVLLYLINSLVLLQLQVKFPASFSSGIQITAFGVPVHCSCT